MTESPKFSESLRREIPRLRAYGASLGGSIAAADDLVQETLIKAWAHQGTFTPGTNLRAWLFTILRNAFYSQRRKHAREVADDGETAGLVSARAAQHGRLEYIELQRALKQIPPDQREALFLISVSGYSYAEAAAICNSAEGTIKSRVNRARRRLGELLDITNAAEIGPDGGELAVLTASVARRSRK